MIKQEMKRLIINLTNKTMLQERKHNHIKDQHIVVDIKSLQVAIIALTFIDRVLGIQEKIRDKNRDFIPSTKAIRENKGHLKISMVGMAEVGNQRVEDLLCQ